MLEIAAFQLKKSNSNSKNNAFDFKLKENKLEVIKITSLAILNKGTICFQKLYKRANKTRWNEHTWWMHINVEFMIKAIQRISGEICSTFALSDPGAWLVWLAFNAIGSALLGTTSNAATGAVAITEVGDGWNCWVANSPTLQLSEPAFQYWFDALSWFWSDIEFLKS